MPETHFPHRRTRVKIQSHTQTAAYFGLTFFATSLQKSFGRVTLAHPCEIVFVSLYGRTRKIYHIASVMLVSVLHIILSRACVFKNIDCLRCFSIYLCVSKGSDEEKCDFPLKENETHVAQSRGVGLSAHFPKLFHSHTTKHLNPHQSPAYSRLLSGIPHIRSYLIQSLATILECIFWFKSNILLNILL